MFGVDERIGARSGRQEQRRQCKWEEDAFGTQFLAVFIVHFRLAYYVTILKIICSSDFIVIILSINCKTVFKTKYF